MVSPLSTNTTFGFSFFASSIRTAVFARPSVSTGLSW